MGFLFRTAFWFSLVLLVLPIDVGSSEDKNGPGPGPVETFVAARQAIGDMVGLCDRQPGACEIGRSALHTVGLRAREAARIAYETLDRSLSEKPAADVPAPDRVADVIDANRAAATDRVTTGSTPHP